MELTDFNAKTTEIMEHREDQGAVSNALAELTKGFSDALAAQLAAEKKAQELEAKNKKLSEDNMNLFLRVQVPDKSEPGYPVRPEEKNTIEGLFTNGRLNLKG